MKKYLIDTNALGKIFVEYITLDAYRDIIKQQLSHQILIHYEVFQETNKHLGKERAYITRLNDAIDRWSEFCNKENFYLSKNNSYCENVQNELIRIYSQNDYTKFIPTKPKMYWADPWLVSYASYYGCTIVTQEGFDVGSQRRKTLKAGKIHTICEMNNIRSISVIDMLNEISDF